jgi:glucose/arabinose dehydrogenase
VTDKLPGDTHHGRRVLRFGPDGLLYFGIGVPCNVCRLTFRGSYQFGAIYRFNLASKVVTMVATGGRG